MKPLIHAQNSVKRYGGDVRDYIAIHDWFDQTKITWADTRHRAILHNTFGIFLCEQFFGTWIENSDGKKVSVRDVAEDHVAEDHGGKIPTVEEWLSTIETQPWMQGKGQTDYVKRDMKMRSAD